MELNEIVDRMLELIPEVDRTIEIPPRGDKQFLHSAGAAEEDLFVRSIMEAWVQRYPEELPGICVERRSDENLTGCLQIPYPLRDGQKNLGRADLGFTTNSAHPDLEQLEWLIEIKKIEFVGDIGWNLSEYGVATLLSPFPATGGIIGDLNRIRSHPDGQRKAIVVYGFGVDSDRLEYTRDHLDRCTPIREGQDLDRYEQLQKVMSGNNNHRFCLEDLLDSFEVLCKNYRHQLGERVTGTFDGLTRHPILIEGVISAWEVFGPEEEE